MYTFKRYFNVHQADGTIELFSSQLILVLMGRDGADKILVVGKFTSTGK